MYEEYVLKYLLIFVVYIFFPAIKFEEKLIMGKYPMLFYYDLMPSFNPKQNFTVM